MISTWQFYQIFVLWIIMSSSLNVGGRCSLFQEDFLWKCGHLYTTRWEHILLFCIFPIKFCILIESWSRRGDALLTLSADDDDEVFSNHNSFYNLRLNEGFLSQHPTCVPTPRNEKIGCLLVPSKRTHDSTVTNVLENEKKTTVVVQQLSVLRGHCGGSGLRCEHRTPLFSPCKIVLVNNE